MSTYHHGDLRVAVLRAAEEIIEERGLAALSVREAARRARVSHSAPYRHFPDREALLAELAADGFRRLGEQLESRRGLEMGESYVRFALAHPNRFRLMFGGQIEIGRHPALRAAAERTFEALVAAFEADSNVADPRSAAAAAWALVHGLAHLMLDGHLSKDEEVARILGAVRFAVGAQRAS